MTLKNRIISTLFQQRAITVELDALVKAYTEQGKFFGAVLVARDGHILLSKGYGMANLDYDVPNTPQTAFRIGSLTKTFTAIAIMQHIEAGRMSLTDLLSRFVPDFPNADRITVHQLLSNTSGIPDYIVMPAYEKLMKRAVTLDEIIALFRDEPLLFEPGTDFGYSNGNWVLLGLILEQLDGKPYAQVMRDRIFEPANMPGAGYDWDQPVIKGRAVGYFSDGERLMQADVVHESTMHAAGGLYMTAEDLFAFDRALDDGRLLRADTLARMTEEVQPGYAYGWEVHSLYNQRVVSHSGGIPGFVCNFVRLDNATIVILSNFGSASFGEMTDKLAAILLGEPYEMPSARTFVTVDPAVYTAYVGEYKTTYFGRTSILRLAVEGDKLVMNIHGLPKSILSPMSETKFYARSKGEVEMTFIRDSAGQVNSIDMLWDRYQLTAERLN